jgi:hypothetical protein
VFRLEISMAITNSRIAWLTQDEARPGAVRSQENGLYEPLPDWREQPKANKASST